MQTSCNKEAILSLIHISLVFVSELGKVRERVRTAHWQLHQDIETLLEEGQLCRGLTDYALEWDGIALSLERSGCQMCIRDRIQTVPAPRLNTLPSSRFP